MRITISGRNIDISEALRDTVESNLGKLAKYFSDDTEARVTLGTRKEAIKIEVTIPTKVGLVRAESEDKNLDAALDDVEDIIEKQIKKYKKKLIDKKHSGESLSQAFIDANFDVPEDDEIQIKRTKTFELRPMDPEEACLQMEMSGHDFFAFLNSETNLISVVYKRKGGSYGLIEPEK